MNKAPQAKIFFLLTAVAALSGAGVCYMQLGSLGEAQQKLDQLKPELKSERQLRTEIAEGSTELKKTQAVVFHLEKGVPQTAYIPTMLKDLETRTKLQGLQFLGIREVPRPKGPEVKGEKKPYVEIDFEISARGKYGDVMRFVRSLEDFPKIVATRGVTMQPKSNPKGPKLLEVTLELRTYMFPEDTKKPIGSQTTMLTPKDGVQNG